METEEKNQATLLSVIAAVFLTLFKLAIGLLSNSLGILSEALHSGLDFIAALITFFSIRMSDKPADKEHPFGHGKIESISALIQTLLLVITCFWIIYQSINRLISKEHDITLSIWAFVVIIVSIIIDYMRSRHLYKVAKKYRSQAIEADALHFSSDILSSIVVLIGLIGVYFDYHFMDSVAALIVSLIVLQMSYKLGKESIRQLIDTAPQEYMDIAEKTAHKINGIKNIYDVRVRISGSECWIELTIAVHKNLSVEESHYITEELESRIKSKIHKCCINIHVEPI